MCLGLLVVAIGVLLPAAADDAGGGPRPRRVEVGISIADLDEVGTVAQNFTRRGSRVRASRR